MPVAVTRHRSTSRHGYVTGVREKPWHTTCNNARSSDYAERCGPQAWYWEARSWPAWLWNAAPVAISLVVTIGYIAFLWSKL
jgi:hypothetical protein